MKAVCIFTIDDDMKSSTFPDGARYAHVSFDEGISLIERMGLLADMVAERIVQCSHPR